MQKITYWRPTDYTILYVWRKIWRKQEWWTARETGQDPYLEQGSNHNLFMSNFLIWKPMNVVWILRQYEVVENTQKLRRPSLKRNRLNFVKKEFYLLFYVNLFFSCFGWPLQCASFKMQIQGFLNWEKYRWIIKNLLNFKL